MKLRDIIFVISGFVLALFVIQMYGVLRSEPVSNYTEDSELAQLNDAISKQRANTIVLAANKVSPSVVSITVVQTRVVSASPFFSPFNDEFFRDFFRDFAPELYYKKKIKNLGSGIIISADGYIITNEHVISNATDINVTLPDGRRFKSKLIAAGVKHDLALLKIDGQNLPYAELGNSSDLMIGEWVIALGNPFGFLLEDTRPTVTVGVISAIHRTIKSTFEDRIFKNMIQTDAAINPGNSGGPLVNVLGQVIGINTAIFSSGGGSEGIGFAQPISSVKKFIKEAKKYRKVRTPWIGIWMQDITPKIAEALGIEKSGVIVSNVDKESSADESGIKEGDRIISVNKYPINRVADWDRFVSNVYVDDTLNISLIRDNNKKGVNLVVKELIQPSGVEKNVVVYGIHIDNLTPRLKKKYKLGYSEGVVVTKVEPNSIGVKLDIRPGDVILTVGNMRIKNTADFQKAFQTFSDTYVIIDRGGLIIHLYFGL
jgi:serine protease Do